MKNLGRIIIILAALAGFVPATAQRPEEGTKSGGSGFMHAWSSTTRGMLRRAGGYIPAGDKIGIGPMSTFVGYNTVEKLRLGVGLTTTAALSRRFALRGYGAYGFGDHRWKYGAEVEWALSPVNPYFGAYPVNSLSLTYTYDLDPLGTGALSPYPPRMPFRLSLRHNEMMLYRSHGALTYARELSRRASVGLEAGIDRYTPTPYIPFLTSEGNLLGAMTAASITAEGSITPGGDIFQTLTSRLDLKPYAPVIKGRIRYSRGLHRSAQTDITTFEAIVAKLTPLGSSPATANILLHGSATAGHAPYPFLPSIPTSPFILRTFGSFALPGATEFPVDAFVDLHGRVSDGGILLAFIPPLRPLGINLTASASAVVGSISSRNSPLRSTHNLPLIPGIHSHPLSWTNPYAEAAVGIDKFLGFIRLEYVWRLSYRHTPGARRSGLSLGLDLTF